MERFKTFLLGMSLGLSVTLLVKQTALKERVEKLEAYTVNVIGIDLDGNPVIPVVQPESP